MSIEYNLPFKTRELKGVRTSKNTAAEMLESHLGIQFPVKPDAVVLDWKNKLAYAKSQRVATTIGSMIKMKSASGYYDPAYHTYFTGKDNDLFVSLHENMHGFNASVNYEFGGLSKKLADMVEAQVGGAGSQTIDIEKTMVLRCVDEGIAQWSAMEVAKELPDDFSVEDIENVRNGMFGINKTDNKNIIPDRHFIEQQFDKVQEAIDLYKQAHNSEGNSVLRLGFKAEAVSSEALYITGLYFTEKAIKYLLDKGFSKGEALTILVKNPPTTINEIKNPDTFINHLQNR